SCNGFDVNVCWGQSSPSLFATKVGKAGAKSLIKIGQKLVKIGHLSSGDLSKSDIGIAATHYELAAYWCQVTKISYKIQKWLFGDF
ncbi:hypothetical protein, partial [Porphyromonas uenonis]|uniref:hypothetical protein n=1 Tax=Porphyromonas uenonis TaxID=281920 RepID=UPI001EE2F661